MMPTQMNEYLLSGVRAQANAAKDAIALIQPPAALKHLFMQDSVVLAKPTPAHTCHSQLD